MSDSWDRAATGEADSRHVAGDENEMALQMADLAKHVRGMEADATSMGTAFESKELRARFMQHREAAMASSKTVSAYLKLLSPPTPQVR